MRKAARTSIVFTLALVAAIGPAQASDPEQEVEVFINLSEFNNSNIIAGFKSTDVLDVVHTCTPGSGSTCTVQHGYSSPPKNISNFLCIPNSLEYQISFGCQKLLEQGTPQKCHENSLGSHCEHLGSDLSQVSPACNWRTNDNDQKVVWNWVLGLQDQTVSVDCQIDNYQGPEQ